MGKIVGNGLFWGAVGWLLMSTVLYQLGSSAAESADTHNNCMAGAGGAYLAIAAPFLGLVGGVVGMGIGVLKGNVNLNRL